MIMVLKTTQRQRQRQTTKGQVQDRSTAAAPATTSSMLMQLIRRLGLRIRSLLDTSSTSVNTNTGTRTRTTKQHIITPICRQYAVLILIIIASLDNADKQLLASSFSILERLLRLDVEQLGYFSLVTNLSYALSLPMWGWCIHHLTTRTARKSINGRIASAASSSKNNDPLFKLLAVACSSWGVATIGIAIVTLISSSSSTSSSSSLSVVSWMSQIVLRALNGVALGSIIPLSQSLLVEVTPAHLRGQAFGLLSVGEKLAGAVSSSAVVYVTRWQDVYYCLGIASIIMGIVASSIGSNTGRNGVGGDRSSSAARTTSNVQHHHISSSSSSKSSYKKKHSDLPLDATQEENDENNEDEEDGRQQQDEQSGQPPMSLREIILRIARLPAFACLVAQGVFGGTPWDMMSYLLMLMDWKGLTKEQIVTIQFTNGLASMLGGWVGGVMGDVAASWFDNTGSRGGKTASSGSSRGRILLALVSVFGGIPTYGLFIYSSNFKWALLWSNLFNFWATWTPSGAIRPICADLTNGPSERAQIVALWIVLEKFSGAIFGAPLIGYLTSRMLQGDEDNGDSLMTKADALAFNLFLLSSIFWSVCAFFWLIMLFVMTKQQSSSNNFALSPRSASRSTKILELQSLIE